MYIKERRKKIDKDTDRNKEGVRYWKIHSNDQEGRGAERGRNPTAWTEGITEIQQDMTNMVERRWTDRGDWTAKAWVHREMQRIMAENMGLTGTINATAIEAKPGEKW